MKDKDRFPIPEPWLPEEGALLAETVARWAQREVVERRHALREDYEKLHVPAWTHLMSEVGLQDLLWPTDDTEAPFTAVACGAVIEQVGRADTGLAVLLANTWALQHLVPDGIKPRLGERGAVGALVLPAYGGVRPGESISAEANPAGSEPSAAFHGLTPQVRASERDGGWVLTGRRVRPQAHGAEAAWFGVLAEVGGRPAVFAVPGDARGLSRQSPFRKTGLHSSRNADLDFEDVVVEADLLLARGEAPVRGLLSEYYLGCAAAAQGGLLALHAILDDWCDSRVIKGRGQAFKDNPLVAAVLGEVGGSIATGRLQLFALGQLLDAGEPGAEATFATATAVTRTVLRAAMDALDRSMELMASAGYATEWNLERYWRDTRTLSTYLLLETAGQMDLARHFFGCRNL